MTRDEIREWMEHPVTAWALKRLTERIDEEIANIVRGGTLGDRTGEETAKTVGRVEGLRFLTEIGDYADE